MDLLRPRSTTPVRLPQRRPSDRPRRQSLRRPASPTRSRVRLPRMEPSDVRVGDPVQRRRLHSRRGRRRDRLQSRSRPTGGRAGSNLPNAAVFLTVQISTACLLALLANRAVRIWIRIATGRPAPRLRTEAIWSRALAAGSPGTRRQVRLRLNSGVEFEGILASFGRDLDICRPRDRPRRTWPGFFAVGWIFIPLELLASRPRARRPQPPSEAAR